jgi:Transcriptional regulator containing an amidase domain and an AraC-type DNA-binding HTH domain
MKRNVAILVFDDVEILDFAGPFEVFAVADELSGHTEFHTFTLALKPGTIRARNGLKIVPDFTLEHCPPPQVIVVPGGNGRRALMTIPSLHEWLRLKSRKAEIVMSVCTGAFVLAAAGLLDGLRVTTHHDALAELREFAPQLDVIDTARFTDNGHILTAAGISAGIDCSLHVVARLLGRAAADRTARHMEYTPHSSEGSHG